MDSITKGLRPNRILKRGMAFWLALVIAVLPVIAHSIQTEAATAKLENKGYIIAPGNNISVCGHTFHTMLYWIINGKPSYCIEPGRSAKTGSSMESTTLSDLSDEQQQLVSYALYYGNSSANGSRAYYAATQTMIWCIVLDCYYNDEAMEEAKATIELYVPGTAAYFDTIWDKMKEALKGGENIPSFASNSVLNMPTYALNYDESEGKYIRTLTDENQMVKNYDFSNANWPSGVTVSVSGDTVTIKSNAPVDTATIEVSPKPGTAVAGSSSGALLFWSGKDGRTNQDMVEYDGVSQDPVNCFFKLGTSDKETDSKRGSVSITVSVDYTIDISKKCTETGEGLGNTDFIIYEDGDELAYVTTDSDGAASYTETKTATFTAEYKEDDDEEGDEESDDDDDSDSDVFSSREEAEAYLEECAEEFRNTEYTYLVEEAKARLGYVLHMYHPEDKAIPEETIAGDETAVFDVEDHRTVGEVEIKKEDLETGSRPQGDATLKGAVYGLYAAAPLIHPDGHTGELYEANELVAIASTQEDGSAHYELCTEGKWAGKPLLLGSYYVKELARSEGYELSVSGIHFKETNRDESQEPIMISAGGSVVSSGLYRNGPDEYDENEMYFTVEAGDLTEGYDVKLTGLPKGTKIFRSDFIEEEKTENLAVGKEERGVVDLAGNPVYETAKGGELKLDLEGNPVIKTNNEGETVWSDTPIYETYTIMEEITEVPGEESGKEEVSLLTATPSVATSSNASHSVPKATPSDIVLSKKKAERLSEKMDYSDSLCIYDKVNECIIINKTEEVDEAWIDFRVIYKKGSFTINADNTVTVRGYGYQEIDEDSGDVKTVPLFEPEYERYKKGETLLDEEGNAIQKTEFVEIFEEATYTQYVENRQIIAATYEKGSYSFHIDGTGDRKDTYVVVLPDKADGTEIFKNAGLSVEIPFKISETAAGSYIKTITLSYPGQTIIMQDGGTLKEPIIVQERVIKQALRVTKTIAKDSYKNNSYGIEEKNKLPDFFFKVYLVSDLVRAGLLLDQNGTYDYKRFFEEHPEEARTLACVIDEAAYDRDKDLTTIHASQNKNADYWFATTTMLPYGRYVIVEQQPVDMPNKQYEISYPVEVMVPFIPEDGEDKQTPSREYFYHADMGLEDMNQRYGIRLGIESDTIMTDKEQTRYGTGEDVLHVDRNSLTETQLKDYDGQFMSALIPWSVLKPSQFSVGGLDYTQKEDYKNFIGYEYTDFENQFYSSKLRVEKLDADTGENIIHDGAYFKIYKAKRDEKTGNVMFDKNGNPIYSESDLITQYDETGAEVGIFKAFSTVADIVTDEGVKSEIVGYIETYKPLGAGAYVLLEVSAPEGYAPLNHPVGVEIYSDKITYYPNGEDSAKDAQVFQYAVPLENPDMVEVGQLLIHNKPLKITLHKVEDGEETVTYQVEGSETELLARQKQEGPEKVKVAYDAMGSFLGYATITHRYSEWSEHMVEGSEQELKTMHHVRPLYREDGTFSGKGIRYDIYVGEATMTLYKGAQVGFDADGKLTGVQITFDENGHVTGITATEMGSTTVIKKTGTSEEPPKLEVFDTVTEKNEASPLLFYNLSQCDTEYDPETERLYLLDDRGNRICLLDRYTGLAYEVDDKGRAVAYQVDSAGEKIIFQQIHVFEKADGSLSIYSHISYKEDENGLPVYYTGGELTLEDTIFITPAKEKKEGTIVARIPVGAYLLEETKVPYDQGYIQSEAIAFVIESTDEMQEAFMEDDFTKIELSKRDITTKQEIEGAEMTLYVAERVTDDSERGFHLEKVLDENGATIIRESWISGKEPHWIDHIPVGDYILEETLVPYKDGYVKSEDIEVIVLETGEVQGYIMEDDYTAVEIKKLDADTKQLIDGAELTLYQAALSEPLLKDKWGVPILDDTKLLYDDGARLVTGETVFSFITAKNPADFILSELNEVVAPNAVSYMMEDGTVRIDYLPTGYYVLRETNVPFEDGYTTADDVLIKVESMGQDTKVQYNEMPDYPTDVIFTKTDLSGHKEVKGAALSIYKVKENGEKEPNPVMSWVSGSEGVYGEGDKIPDGFTVGELKPHEIKYLPVGNYILIEEQTPYGFLESEPVTFTVQDTKHVQKVSMVDKIPEGYIKIHKVDEKNPQISLAGAEFTVTNCSTNEVVATLVTGDDGFATSETVPIGYTGNDGVFVGYDYEVVETKAPSGYLNKSNPYVFQFAYVNDETPVVTFLYEFGNGKGGDLSVSKKDITNQKELPGATLVVKDSKGNVIEEWVSTLQPHLIKGLTDGIYTLTETMAPAGYLKAETIAFEIESGKLLTEVFMYDDVTKTAIEKVDHEGDSLSGAELELTSADGQFVDSWISDNTPYMIYGLEAGKEYVLRETEAPDGYVKAQSKRFACKGTDKVQKITMENKPTRVKISKTDITGKNELPGATLTILDEYDEVVESWVSENHPHYIEGLPTGEYTLREETAPYGYLIAQEITFRVKNKTEIQKVVMKDEAVKGRIIVHKTDSVTNIPLKGVKFEIRDFWGRVLGNLETDQNGYAESELFDIGSFWQGKYQKQKTYYLVETEAAKGYLPETEKRPITFEYTDGYTAIVETVIEVTNTPVNPYLPQTGDDFNPSIFYAAGAGIMLLGAALYLVRKKKKK